MKATSSPLASVAVTVPIAVWFSAALKVADEVNIGIKDNSRVASFRIP